MIIRRIGMLILLCACAVQTLQAQPGTHRDFKKADSIARLFSGYSLNNPRELAFKLTDSFTTDIVKFRAIFTWVCLNISNDYVLFTQHQRRLKRWHQDSLKMAEWNRSFRPRVLHNLIEKHATVCTGYAFLVDELAYHTGIDVRVINGYGRLSGANVGGEGIMNHSWNAVRLDGQWYLCDPTWASGYIAGREKKFVLNYDDVYFLTDPELFILQHYPEDSYWSLLESPPALDEFLNGPVVYRSGVRKHVIPVIPGKLKHTKQPGEGIKIHFKSEQVENVSVVCSRHGKGTLISSSINRVKNGYSLTTWISKKGVHDIHILFDDKPVMSYQIRIKE